MNFRSWASYKSSAIISALGLAHRGYFVPYRHGSAVNGALPSYKALEADFEGAQDRFRSVLDSFAPYLPEIQTAVQEGRIPWDEAGMFPVVDVVAAYALIRELRPARILEIGSGASSHVSAAALAANGSGRLTCIDPEPRRSITDLGVELHRRPLQHGDTALIEGYGKNDVLFIDSSHVFLPGVDVDIQFNHFFPELPSGAVVHVHDVFLPDDYPQDWRMRNYAEQTALVGWLHSKFFEVIFPGYYVATRMEADLRKTLGDLAPKHLARNAGSIWLRRL